MSAQHTPAARILFVGNSFTSRNDLPGLLRELAAAAHAPASVASTSIVAGGASLRRHWNAGTAQRALAGARFDVVVLQEQSTLPLKNPARYHENVRLFVPEVAKHGAKIALYQTWARRHQPQAHAHLASAVDAIGAEVGATVVPVGRVWHALLAEDPALGLYADDGSHPTAAGSYLAACVFLVRLLDRDPAGWGTSDRLGIDRAVAARLHGAATASRGETGRPR